jgi:N-acetylneuraminic acid mutarotase
MTPHPSCFAPARVLLVLALGAAACSDQPSPTAPSTTKLRAPDALDPSALKSPLDDLTVPNTWTTLQPIPGEAALARAATLNGIIYVVGGYGNGTDRVLEGRRVQAYRVATNAWSTRRPLPSAKYGVNGVSALNGRLYVTGGFNSLTELPTKTVHTYNPATNSWVRKADLPAATAGGAQAVIGGQLYVYGTTRNGGHFLWRYNAANDTWITRRTPPSTHLLPTAGVIGGKLYLAGGLVSNSGPDNMALHVYNPATNSWATRAPLSERMVGNGGSLNNRLYAAGSGVQSASLLAYDPATNTWTTRAPLPTPRYFAAGAVADGRLFIIGGSSPNVTDAVEAYTP